MKFYWLYRGKYSARIVVAVYPTYFGDAGTRVYSDDGYFKKEFGDDFIITKEAFYAHPIFSKMYSYENMLEELKKFLVKEML